MTHGDDHSNKKIDRANVQHTGDHEYEGETDFRGPLDIGGRRSRRTSDITIDVPGDFSSPQDALDAAVALSMESQVTVAIDGSTYNEDVIIPAYMVGGGATPDGITGRLTIQGSSDGSGNPTTELNSMLVVGAQGVSDPNIKSIKFLSDNPHFNESFAVGLQGCSSPKIKNCAFGADVTDGIIFYQSGGKAEACNYDNVDTGVYIKRGGMVTVTQSEGSPTTLLEVGEGMGVKKASGGVTPTVPIGLSGGGGIAIDADPSTPEILFTRAMKNVGQFNQGFGYPGDVNLANATPKIDGQMLRDDGTNAAQQGEYYWADTSAGVWRAVKDPTITVTY